MFEPDLVDRALLKALSHPLRLRVLEALTDGSEASPVQLSRRFGVPLSTVSRQVRILRELGFVEQTRAEPRRGALEHFYRAIRRPFIDDAEWGRLPVALRRGLMRQTFRKVLAEASEAGGRGGFDAQHVGIARVPLRLDGTGEREASTAVLRLMRELSAIQARADARRRGDADRPTRALRIAVLHFHADVLSSSEPGEEWRSPPLHSPLEAEAGRPAPPSVPPNDP